MTKEQRRKDVKSIPGKLIELAIDAVPRSTFLQFIGILVTILLVVFGVIFSTLSSKVSMDSFNRFEQRQYEYNEKLLERIQNLSLLINTNATLIMAGKDGSSIK